MSQNVGSHATLPKPRTYIYIDGFNLYYGCLEHQPYRWLDLEAFCWRLLPKNDIQRIIKKEFDKVVGVAAPILNPDRHLSNELRKRADFLKEIRASALAKSQLPDVLTDRNGRFRRPARW